MSTASKEITMKIDGQDVEYIRKDLVHEQHKTGNEVIVRTYSAGVHIGEIESKDGIEITLKNARRLWSWSKAFTLSAVATKGVDRSNSRISVSVPKITLQWIEIIPVVSGVDLSTTEK